MPELPDVEIFRRYVDKHTHGHRVRDVHVLVPEMLAGIDARQLRERVRGRAITGAHRHGKYLFLDLGPDTHVVLHFGMSGFPQYLSSAETPSPYTRILFELDEGRLAYVVPRKLGRVALVTHPEDFISEKELGMDALDKRLSFAVFRERLTGHGTLKCVLMNQSLIAGVGNIYSDEILFHARLDPRRTIASLDAGEWRRLYKAMQQVLTQAIAHDASPDHMPEDWLLRHRKAGAHCDACGGVTAHLTLCGRSAYFCPACQH